MSKENVKNLLLPIVIVIILLLQIWNTAVIAQIKNEINQVTGHNTPSGVRPFGSPPSLISLEHQLNDIESELRYIEDRLR